MFLYVLASVKIPYIDTHADAYFAKSIQEATVAYATTRGVNAVISVLKESEIEISPVGVGVNIAAGQILDPIDDMTERLSSVIVTAIVSLGIQKITYEIGEAISFKIIAFLLPLLVLLVWLNPKGGDVIASLVIKVCLLVFILRFLLPISSIINNALYDNVLRGKITLAKEKLSVVSNNYEDLSRLDKNDSKGFFSTVTRDIQNRIDTTKQIFTLVVDNVDQIVASLLQLTTLYLSAFVIQVLIVPILLLWLAFRVSFSGLVTQQSNDFVRRSCGILFSNHADDKQQGQ